MAEKKIIANSDKAPKAIGLYSQAVKANGLLFLSGQLPLDPVSGKITAGGIKEQTLQVMRNLQAVLAKGGLNFTNVVKTNIYLRNMSDFEAVNLVYASYLSAEPPALAVEGTSGLPSGAMVEIEMIASYNVKKVVGLNTPRKSTAPFSPAVKTDGLLFLSGQMPIDASGGLVAGDITAQTQLTMNNIGTILKSEGLDFGAVIKTNAYLKEFKDMAAFNKTYAQFFKKDFPTRCALEAGSPPMGAGLVLDMIATYSGKTVVTATPGLSTNPNPLSPALKTGGYLIMSGQIPRDLFTGKVENGADIAAQTDQVMKSLQVTLAAAGLSFADVVKSTVFLTNIDEYGAINDVYTRYITNDPPAQTIIGVAKMNSNVRVEIEMIAVMR
jgi:reactive intermediate/imine deaminase